MIKTAYFAGGCFWCITPIFKLYDGVKSVTSGYSGGKEENPAYEDVKHQKTGHRETIKVEYDDSEVDFSTLMDIYLANVDPFDGKGQFIDKGFSYTLAVFYTDEEQKSAAGAKIAALQDKENRPVQIALEPFRSFYPAEEYHQDYFLKNPEAFEKEMKESGRRK
jgi:peptide-methionine (S)-S-oxide reductase